MLTLLKRLVTNVFPPPRKRVTLMSVLPLVLFLVVFGGGCLFLDLAGVMRFSSARPFLLLVFTPWVWWMYMAGFSGLSRFRSTFALIVRLLVFGAFVMLLADPRAVRKSHVLSVVYALDLSDSIDARSVDDSLSYVASTATKKPEDDEAGLVVFGRNAAVELPPRISLSLEGDTISLNTRIARDGTNLAKGLSLAAAVVSEENQGRIVLISDGTGTEGDLSRVINELNARKIPVDVLPIEYGYDHEVWLEKLELPKFVKVGETYEAVVILSSLQDGRGKLILEENGETISGDGVEVEFKAGKNRYVLPLYLRRPGYYEYVARIEVPPKKDGWQENNIAVNQLYLAGEGKVLVVTDPAGDARDWEDMVKAIRKGKRVVELTSAYEFPRDALSLVPYDCIVFPNVPADAFDVVQLEAVKDAVYNMGIGFVMVGGENSYGPGGFHRTPVEDALPVTMDISQKKVLPKGALVIILHTCEFPQGNTWGKRIAKQAIRVLGAQDEVGCLAYGASAEWIFKLTPAGEYERLVRLINRAVIGDMPDFGTTMQMGLNGLKASDAAMKHVIIISDGDPSPPTPGLLKQFAAAKVSVSTVAIYPHGMQQELAVMKAIASATGGRFYFPKTPQRLPAIFIKEAKTLRRSMIQNKIFTPSVEFPSAILKGIDKLPQLRGYVLTSPKPRSVVILKGPESEDVNPVLAIWRYGVGTAAAFTSDLSPNWGADWVEWDRYQAFVKQLMIKVSRVKRKSDITMRSFVEGNKGVVVVEDAKGSESFLEIEVRAVGPDRRAHNLRLRQVGPGRYQGAFPLWGKGRYQVTAVAGGEGRSERATAGFAVPYSPEYLRFRSNPVVLEEIARKTGGRLLRPDEEGEEIFVKERKPKETTRSVMDIFLLLLAIAVPLDVGFRRIQLDWQLIRGWFRLGRKVGASGETLGALLRRKKQIRFTAGEEEGPRPQPAIPRASALRPTAAEHAPKREPPATKPAAAGEDAAGLSTTARLLKMKKKWKQKEG